MYLKRVIPLDHEATLVGLFSTRFLLHLIGNWSFGEVKMFHTAKEESQWEIIFKYSLLSDFLSASRASALAFIVITKIGFLGNGKVNYKIYGF